VRAALFRRPANVKYLFVAKLCYRFVPLSHLFHFELPTAVELSAMSAQTMEVPNLPKDQRSPYSDYDSVLDRRSSRASSRFRESTHLIPTPGPKGERAKRFEPILAKVWVVIAIAVVMTSLAIGLEVGLYFSQKNDGKLSKKSFLLFRVSFKPVPGFHVPQRNVFTFASAEFLVASYVGFLPPN
jgi:hypothetical protein